MFVSTVSRIAQVSIMTMLPLLGAACAGNAGDDGSTSDPIIGGTSASNYLESADVQLYQDGSLYGWCSGSLIAPQVIMTAGHCVVGITSWKVTLPFAHLSGSATKSATTYASDPSDPDTVNPSKHDIGLIFLSEPLKIATFPTLATSELASNATVDNLGRIKDGKVTNTFYISAGVKVKSASSEGYPYDYESTDKIESGDSGGPDVVPGTHEIVAVNSGAGGGTQLLARVDLVHTWIETEVKAHGGFATD